jgi:hypothetical protein
MLFAIFQLIAVLIVAALAYWILEQLWQFTGTFGASWIGRLVYTLLIIAGVVAIVFFGVLPLLYAIAAALGGAGSFPRFGR